MFLPFLVLIVILLAALIGWIFVNRVRPLVYGVAGKSPAAQAEASVAEPAAAVERPLPLPVADAQLPPLTLSEPIPECPVCGATAKAFAEVDFNKSGWNPGEKLFQAPDHPVGYAQCSACQFTFAPAFWSWSQADFERWIYNADYLSVDPHSAQERPHVAAEFLTGFLGVKRASIRHLDYGNRGGQLSLLLNTMGWTSLAYDPFAGDRVEPGTLGQFDLITLIEVIQHVPDPHALMRSLMPLLQPDGMMIISTNPSDGELDSGNLNWWYALPRNGHFSLYSRKALSLLAPPYQMRHYGSELNWNILVRGSPSWAKDLMA